MCVYHSLLCFVYSAPTLNVTFIDCSVRDTWEKERIRKVTHTHTHTHTPIITPKYWADLFIECLWEIVGNTWTRNWRLIGHFVPSQCATNIAHMPAQPRGVGESTRQYAEGEFSLHIPSPFYIPPISIFQFAPRRTVFAQWNSTISCMYRSTMLLRLSLILSPFLKISSSFPSRRQFLSFTRSHPAYLTTYRVTTNTSSHKTRVCTIDESKGNSLSQFLGKMLFHCHKCLSVYHTRGFRKLR